MSNSYPEYQTEGQDNKFQFYGQYQTDNNDVSEAAVQTLSEHPDQTK